MIVSAPAPAALHVPVVSLAPSLDAKDPNAAKTIPFRNVFDSLTLLEDLQHERGAKQEGAAKNSSTKKERPAESGTGTEELVVPQIPSLSAPKPSLVLPQFARGNMPENNAAAEVTTLLPSTSSAEQSDVKGVGTVTSLPAPPAASLPYTRQTSNTVPLAVTTLPPPKEQVTAGASATQSAVEPQPTAKPRAASFVSMPLASPGKAEPGEDETAGLPIRTTAREVWPSTGLASEKPVTASVPTPQNAEIETAATARVKAPVVSADPIAEQLPPSNSSEALAPVEPSKPWERLSPAKAQAASPEQTPEPVEIAAPAPQPRAASAPAAKVPAADPSDLPPPTVSFVEREPPAPLPADREVVDRAAQPEALSATAAPRITLLPQAENFAFAARIEPVTSPDNTSATQSTPVGTNETPLTQSKTPSAPPQGSDSQQTAAGGSQTSSNPGRETQPAAPETERSEAGAQNLSYSLGAQPTPGVTQHWSEAAVWQAPEFNPMPGAQEHAEAHASLPLAAQEAHLLAPDLPKTSASSEILLHLTGNDQSAAAIRVTDRAGSVNVSVHASDPVLRESLRSNLGELSTQLNGQGWKADVMKSAVAAMQSGGPQDSHEDGQRGSQPQQSFGDRQPQRDRRANGGQWQQELDQQISGGEAHSGGNR